LINQKKINKLTQLTIVAVKRSAEASEASPPNRLRKTTPRTAGGIAAKSISTSFQSFGKSKNDATVPASNGFKNNLNNITIPKGIKIVRIFGNLNIRPIDKIAIGVNADAKT